MFNQLNGLSNETNLHDDDDYDDDEDKLNSCKYYHLEQKQSLEIPTNSSKMFHINACFLNRNLDDLEYLSKSTHINYDVIAVSEAMIMKHLERIKTLT